MKTRCYNPNAVNFQNYGAKGVTVCERWRHSFSAFLSDMGPRPSSKHSINRLDNKKGYFKENCEWSTRIKQQNNTSKNVFIDYMGQRRTVSEWCRALGLNRATVEARIRLRNWSPEKALTHPVRPCKRRFTGLVWFRGKRRTVKEWCHELSLNPIRVYERLNRGWPIERALTCWGKPVLARWPNGQIKSRKDIYVG